MLQMSSVLKQHRNSRTLVYKHCGRFWRSASQNMRVCVNWILMNTAHCFWSKTQYGWGTQSCTWNSSCHGIFSTLFPGISCNLPEQSPTSRPSSYRDPILVILEGDRSAPQKHGLKACRKRDCWFWWALISQIRRGKGYTVTTLFPWIALPHAARHLPSAELSDMHGRWPV